MKLIHLSDLHLGKKVNAFSMIEDQKYILNQILGIIDDEKPDGIMIAGDVYDKSVPSVEAVTLFDEFLSQINQRRIETFIISGNHDSSVRLAFGNQLFDTSGIHISPEYDGMIKPFIMSDDFGEVNIYMLPFIKPAHVRNCFPESDVQSYSDAVRFAIEKMNIDPEKRNVLITHQFVTGALRSDSEEISVGGTDQVDAAIFDDFDYVALGHLHRPQNVLSNKIRYCGTPLKYSFSEAGDEKSVTVVELKDELSIRTILLKPLRDMVELKGSYEEIMLKQFYDHTSYSTDYTHITLTDEEDIPNAMAKLRVIYRNLMKLDYDNQRTRHQTVLTVATASDTKTPLALFDDFYEQQNGTKMSDTQNAFVAELIEKIWEDDA